MVLRLQQALVDSPLPNLKAESVRSYIGVLAQRFGLQALLDGDLQQQFYGLLTAIFEANLGWFICDYVAIVCNDKDYSSADPEAWQLLQPAAVLGWSQATASELHKRVLSLFQSGASPDTIIELGHATKTLLSVVGALQSTLQPNSTSSRSAQDLHSTLQLLQQTTQVLGWLEQQQQQRPGQPPLISRSVSNSRALQAAGGLAGLSCKLSPAHDSLPAWQAAVAGKRAAAPSQRLFLDDLARQLLVTSEGQRPLSYPYPDVLGCVEGLFVSGSSNAAAVNAKLALLLYYLLDGGWLANAVPFAQGFQLPLTLVQQWQCHYLIDCAAQQQQQQQQQGGSSSSAALDEACSLLGAVASPATPFRFVEALLAAGRPATALAVQRARCATSSSSSSSAGAAAGLPLSLREAEVLLRVQLGCGLLAEAFSELRRHCSQLLPSKRPSHVKALVQQLAAWTTEEQQANQPNSGTVTQQQQHQQLSRVQQLMQLPLDCEEEAVLLGWFRQRMEAGQSGGHVLPLYLLQRGRSLEALAAYAEFKASTAASAAAPADTSLLQRQLHTLMSAAAAALPPALRATSTAAAAAGGMRPALAGLVAGAGTAVDGNVNHSAAVSDVPTVALLGRGVEAPVFMSQLITAQPEVQGSLAAAAAAVDVDTDMDGGVGGSPAAAEAPAASGNAASNAFLQGSLFGDEVLAEAGPGSVALNNPIAQHSGRTGSAAALQHAPEGAGGSEFVPLLFGTPAPAAAALGGSSGLAAAAAAGIGGSLIAGLDAGAFAASTPGAVLQAPGLFAMSEEDFGRDVLGIGGKSAAAGGYGSAAAAAAGSVPGRRSSKRQKQTPVRR